jgi:hypothetical protein
MLCRVERAVSTPMSNIRSRVVELADKPLHERMRMQRGLAGTCLRALDELSMQSHMRRARVGQVSIRILLRQSKSRRSRWIVACLPCRCHHLVCNMAFSWLASFCHIGPSRWAGQPRKLIPTAHDKLRRSSSRGLTAWVSSREPSESKPVS